MPPLEKIRPQWLALWQLAKGDARGLSAFDITDRGVILSFWAFVYYLPAFLIHAVLARVNYLAISPDLGRSNITFLFQSLFMQIGGWLSLLLSICVFGFALGLRPLLRLIIVMVNWGSIPLLYIVYGLVYPLLLLTSGQTVISWLLQISLLLAVTVSLLLLIWRILATVAGGHGAKRAGYIFLVGISSLWVAHALESSMRLTIP